MLRPLLDSPKGREASMDQLPRDRVTSERNMSVQKRMSDVHVIMCCVFCACPRQGSAERDMEQCLVTTLPLHFCLKHVPLEHVIACGYVAASITALCSVH